MDNDEGPDGLRHLCVPFKGKKVWEESITFRYRYAKYYLALTDRHLSVQLLCISSYNRARIMLRFNVHTCFYVKCFKYCSEGRWVRIFFLSASFGNVASDRSYPNHGIV